MGGSAKNFKQITKILCEKVEHISCQDPRINYGLMRSGDVESNPGPVVVITDDDDKPPLDDQVSKSAPLDDQVSKLARFEIIIIYCYFHQKILPQMLPTNIISKYKSQNGKLSPEEILRKLESNDPSTIQAVA